MAFDEDLTEFFDTDDFAVTATYNGSVTVNGIFDHEYVEVFGGDAGHESALPVFTCRTADAPNAAHDDPLVVDGNNYTVRQVQDDGTGITRLILRSV